MAEILIKARDSADTTHPMAWKAGMPVAIMDDGHPWSPRERLPPADGGSFFILKLPGVVAADLQQQIAARFGGSLTDAEGDVNLRRGVRRRVLDLALAELPQGVRDTIRTTGEFTTTLAAVRNFIRRVRDNQRL